MDLEEKRRRDRDKTKRYYYKNRAKRIAATGEWKRKNSEHWSEYKQEYEDEADYLRAFKRTYGRLFRGRTKAPPAKWYVQSLKAATPCADCGRRFPYYVMHFDHLGLEPKVADVSVMVGQGLPLRTIKEEIAKCEIVCANCHGVRTHLRREVDLDRVYLQKTWG